MQILAFDVCLDDLDSFDGSCAWRLPNRVSDIEQLLRSRPGAIVVCEPTGRYHVQLVDAAVRLGHVVYLVNPREARNYKDSLSFRAKTDRLDAQYLYEYVKRNLDLLRPYKPVDGRLQELRDLLGKRHAIVGARTALAQALGKKLSEVEKTLLKNFDLAIKAIEKQLEAMARTYESYKGLRSIPGVGPISGCALLYALESRPFESSKALVAFLGLDVRVRQSGKYRGLPKVSKRGDPLLRFLMCMAGRGLLIAGPGRHKKAQLQAKGRQYPERMVIAARKILRTAYAIHAQRSEFDPSRWRWG